MHGLRVRLLGEPVDEPASGGGRAFRRRLLDLVGTPAAALGNLRRHPVGAAAYRASALVASVNVWRLGRYFLFGAVAFAATASAIGASPWTSTASPRSGTVVGRIFACSGLGVGPLYAGGTVVALRGTIRFVQESATTGKSVFPTDVAARQRVPTGGEFDFNLSPGHYVIELPYYGDGNNLAPWVPGPPGVYGVVPGGGVSIRMGSWVSVVVRGGITLQADLPNMCE